MSNHNDIKRKAFINELCKIAMSNKLSISDTLGLVKKASFIDESKAIMNCGSGSTDINSLVKIAGDEYYTPPKWEGVSGYHRAVAEDPKTHSSNEIKGQLLGIIPAAVPLAMNSLEFRRAGIQTLKDNPNISDEALESLRKSTHAAINRKYIPYILATAIGGSIAGKMLFSDKYTAQRGIKKSLFGNYSFNQEAQNKYLK